MIERTLKERGEEMAESEKSSLWKAGVLFYTLAWPFTFTSTLTFFLFFYEDQICQTYIDFGFEQWRGFVLLFSVITPMVALTVDFFMNRITMCYKHIVLSALLLVLYFFLSFLGSLA